MLKDNVIPVLTKFFKSHLNMDVVVENMPAINPTFTVSHHDGKQMVQLFIVYTNERAGILPVLNIYHYDESAKQMLDVMRYAKRSVEHYSKVFQIFTDVKQTFNGQGSLEIMPEQNLFNAFKSVRFNDVNKFNKMMGDLLARVDFGLLQTYIYPECVFTICENELHLDLRFRYSIEYSDRIISSHPLLLANNENFYIDLEKELYNIVRSSTISKIRGELKMVLDPKTTTDEELVRYIQLVAMAKI